MICKEFGMCMAALYALTGRALIILTEFKTHMAALFALRGRALMIWKEFGTYMVAKSGPLIIWSDSIYTRRIMPVR
jgi:hypothetical protein